MEITKTLELMVELLKNITNHNNSLVLAIANPLKTEKMQRAMMDYLIANIDNKECMREDSLIEKALEIKHTVI